MLAWFAVLLVIIAGASLSLWAYAPKVLDDTPRDVLILAAHSDDCVIVGAEYAIGALRDGRSVRVVYLTCSGPHPESDIARTRRLEATAAWGSLSRSLTSLTFIDLCESAVAGPIRHTAEETERARSVIASSIRALPADAAVVIPASGESHVDHRTLRRIAIEALRESARPDLIVYESPEYNQHLSLLRAPERTMRMVLRHVPMMDRVVSCSGRAGYVDGPAGSFFHDPARLTKKRELLMYFASQDGRLLVGHFGHPTPYRVLDLLHAEADIDQRVGVRAFGYFCDVSALAFGASVATVIFLAASLLGSWSSNVLLPSGSFGLIVGMLGMCGGCVYVARAARGRASKETAIFACAASLGFAIGAVPGVWR